MHILFLDEAGTAGGPEFVLGGVAVDPAKWQHLRKQWGDAAIERGRDLRTELKWSRTHSADGPASRLIDLLIDCEATAFAVELHTREGRTQEPLLFENGTEIYATALMFIAERFQHYLVQHDSYGAIVIDHRDGAQDDRLRSFFAQLARNGTPFATLDRIIDPILFSPSHDTLGIQAADLVVGPLYALCRSKGGAPHRRALAKELHGRMRPCFARHPHTGEIDGVGIKRFPLSNEQPKAKLFDLKTV